MRFKTITSLKNQSREERSQLKRLVYCLIFSFLSLSISNQAKAGESILAYWITALSVQEREAAIKADFEKGGVDLTVFAKFKEFNEEIKSKGPPFLIAPAEFEFINSDYVPVVAFEGSAGKNFKYKFYTLAEGGAPDVLNSKLGLVEQADRTALKDVVAKLSKKSPKTLKSVSKSEDLFPLLVFKSADVIMLSPDEYESLKEKFSTAVKVIGESEAIDYPKIYAKKGQDAAAVLSAAKAIAAENLKKVGFTGVRDLSGGAK
jgi:hypothetical protein